MTRKILRCPMCRSTDIYWDARGLYATLYYCRQCGYQGAFVLECEEGSDFQPEPSRSSGEESPDSR